MRKLIFSFMIVTFFLFGCARQKIYVRPPRPETIALPETKKGGTLKPYVVNGERYYPLPETRGFTQQGKASWYGEKFQGRPTANGEIFDMHKKTGAHKTLPMGTYVKVLNLSNKKHVVVRINDRGPYVKGRIIDLSYAAAKEIALIGSGLTDVKIVAFGKEVGKLKSKEGSKPLLELKDLENGEFTIQVGAFRDRKNALKLAERLKVIFKYVHISVFEDENRRPLHRVHVSKSKTLTLAGKVEKRLEDMGFKGAFIVRI